MSLKPIQVAVQLFRGPGDLERSRRAITWLMLGLSLVNRDWYLANPSAPRLFTSKVVYRPETTENWQDWPTLLATGAGDCEDLACARIGELMAQGINALPFITWRQRRGGTVYHALVRWPDGKIEDPSLARGMRGAPVRREPVFIGQAVET